MQKPIKLTVKLTESELKKIIGDSINEIYKEGNSILRTINEDYRIILNEEYGIDFETEIETDKIVEEVKNSFKTNSTVSTDENGLKNYIGTIEHSYKGKEIKVNYCIINFVKEDIFDKYYNFYELGVKYKNKTEEININIAMYDGMFVIETFHNSLQHELSHIFKSITNKITSTSIKDNNIYKIATSQIKHPISNLSFELANAVYISFNEEQIAMCNGVDAMFRNIQDINIKRSFSIQQTNEYKYLFYLKKVINNIEEYSDLIRNVYKMTDDKMLTRLKIAYKNYIRRLSRIEIKYKDK